MQFQANACIAIMSSIDENGKKYCLVRANSMYYQKRREWKGIPLWGSFSIMQPSQLLHPFFSFNISWMYGRSLPLSSFLSIFSLVYRFAFNPIITQFDHLMRTSTCQSLADKKKRRAKESREASRARSIRLSTSQFTTRDPPRTHSK